MSLPALDLFALAAAEDAPRAPLREVLTYLGPAQAFDGGVAHISEHTGLWYSVPNDPRNCPWCNAPVHEPHCVAITEDGEWRWAHPVCALTAKGGKSDIVPNAPWKRKEWPPCVLCGAEREQHAFTGGVRYCDDECTVEYKAAA